MSGRKARKKNKIRKGALIVKEGIQVYETSGASHKHKYEEAVYTKVKNQDLILFGVYSILKNKETCTFERLVAECFSMFPNVFGFVRYPYWPDSLKFDRALRTLREKGLIIGGAGGKYSPGEIVLTEFGEKLAKETEAILGGKRGTTYNKKVEPPPRSIDDKLIQYLKDSPLYRRFTQAPDKFSITEPEFRSLLRCTLETPIRILKQNLEYFKNSAKSYNESQLLDFLLYCENKLIRNRSKDG